MTNDHKHDWVGGGSNSQHYILDLHLGFIDSKMKKIYGKVQTIILAPLAFTKGFGTYRTKLVKYSRNHMIDFPIINADTLADYYLSTKDKYKTFYVSSYCILK